MLRRRGRLIAELIPRKPLKTRLKEFARAFKQELKVYRILLRDPETPPLARVLLGLAVGYVLLPFDLIPDFIPVLGQLDDLVIVPGLVWVALKVVPPSLVERCRAQASEAGEN